MVYSIVFKGSLYQLPCISMSITSVNHIELKLNYTSTVVILPLLLLLLLIVTPLLILILQIALQIILQFLQAPHLIV